MAQWEYGVTPAASTRMSRHRRQNSNSTSGGVAYHKFYRQTQLLFSEVAEQSEYGNWYWATDNVDSLTHQSGSDVQVRSAFRNTGALANTNDNNFRAINDAYPTFGFAVGLGKVGSASVSTLFTLGLAQEQSVQFDGANGIVSLPTLWTSYYATELDAVSRYSCSLGPILYDDSCRSFTMTTLQQLASPRALITKSRAILLLRAVRIMSL